MITEPLTSPDHVEIRDIVRDFVDKNFTSERVRAAAASADGYGEATWKLMADLGWTAFGFDEAAGGLGLGAPVQCLVHRELGARLAPSPYLASVAFAGTALSLLADRDAGLPILTTIGDGTTQAALVLGHGRGWPGAGRSSVTARQEDGCWVLDGGADLVLDAARADLLLVVAPLDASSWGLFRLGTDAPGVIRRPVPTVDGTRSFGAVRLESAQAVALHAEPLSTERVGHLVDRMAVYLAAEMTGAAVSCMRQTLDYLRTRQQFGRPIGSFQALKHRCADLAVSLTIVQELLFAAAGMIEAGHTGALRVEAPLLLAQAGEVFKRTTEEAIQLHGGVGFTDELDIGLYYKRALVDNELLAAPADAYARLDAMRERSGATGKQRDATRERLGA
ncbi:acyl-CoA dehydrogenase family protein [Streptomyces sp. NPDC058001]|uniref:acyl-CoA dehydrogenase family protein n=1 Tax=Streptomyces sp. NPDC058001 TaxID=3346300 RepID=UPI0036E9B269